MKPLSETLTELGIDFTFPINIRDENENLTYYENSKGYWSRTKFDENGNITYCEDSDGYWCKWERDASRNVTYCEDSDGYWCKWERDASRNVTYCENSFGEKEGTPRSAKTHEGKVVVVDGVEYELKAL